ncbi:potassium/proton antiporter [Parvularcula sp. IMCC14364]|uniref:potassium/proton antiporter n=1 Tax=Parvularcula sp. IMCC14364 TaxID=3067902 RepID=UPI00274207CF|nr:potassium/proton antiporter [Parvularcula sp. IMCC14364]
MPDTGPIFFTLALFAAGGILVGAAGSRLGAPMLLIFLMAGMLAGREGPGGIEFDQSTLAYFLGSAAIAVILFEGGLRTKPRILKQGLRPGVMLAVPGTVLTAFIVAPVAMLLFDMSFISALLLGAIVSSTDAAAVFALAASGIKLPEKVVSTLEVESGFNDPIAIILVIGLVETLAGQPLQSWEWVVQPVYMLAAGALVGYGVGLLSADLFRHVKLPVGLKAILTIALGLLAFGLADLLSGSGFLAIYLTGVTLAWRAPVVAEDAAPGVDGLAWLAQTGLFLMLGLYVTPSHIAVVALPAAITAIALFALARPAASFLLLLPFKFTVPEKGFIAWTGLRGATPVFLGILPLLGGAPNASLYISVALAVVLVSLVVQGWTAPLVARQLQLCEATAPPDRGEVFSRLGSMSVVLLAGVWFAVANSPVRNIFMEPESSSELIAMVGAGEMLGAGEDSLIATFPADFSDLSVADRQPVYADVVALAMTQVNREIAAEREELLAMLNKEADGTALSLEEQTRRDILARKYKGRYEETGDLLARINQIPPSLAISQSVLATGWGGADGLMQRNAIFGGRAGANYETIIDAARDYADLLNSHPVFSEFRTQSAEMTDGDKDDASGAALAQYVGGYISGNADEYINAINELIRANDLNRYDIADPGTT